MFVKLIVLKNLKIATYVKSKLKKNKRFDRPHSQKDVIAVEL